MEPFGRHVHQDLANLTGQEVPGLRISRLASRYAAAVAERRAREEANRHEFNLNLPHLEAVKNALAEQLEAEGAQINGHLPVASVFDAVQAVKACRGWDKDAGLRALMGHLESMWKRDRSASITASTYLKLHEHYSRNFPKSAAADVLVQIGRAGYATLPISDLQVIASQINTQEDYDRLIQRHGLNGVLPHQVKARRYILALVNEENWEEEEPAEDEGFSTEEPWQGVQQEKERHRRRREDPRRRERGYIFPGQENPNLEGKEDSKGYPILSIDAWADGEDGWTWNNWDKVGVLEDAALLDNEDALIDWFITEGFLKDTAKGKVYVDDDQYNLVITDEETHEPLFAVEYGSHEDEDLPGEPKPGTDEAPPSPERHGGSRRGSEVSEAYENDGGDARGGRDCDHEGAVVDGVCGICHERVSTPTSKQRGGSRRTRPFDGRVAGVWDQTLPSGEMKPQELADLFAEILESEGKLHLENWERVEAARPTPGWDYTVILKGVVQDVREDYGDLGVPRFAVFVQLQGAQDGGGEASGYVQMDRYGTVATSRRNTMEEAIKELAWGTTAAFRSKSEEPQQELDLHEAHRTAALLDDFADGYVTAALWSSNDESDERGGEPLDRNYSVEDIAPGSLAQMVEDCAKFQQENAEDLAQYADLREGRGGEWSSDELAGHDFWLSRNGHGTGFWDRGAGDVGDRLADAARKAGEQDLYVGDDGVIYLAGAETREARKQGLNFDPTMEDPGLDMPMLPSEEGYHPWETGGGAAARPQRAEGGFPSFDEWVKEEGKRMPRCDCGGPQMGTAHSPDCSYERGLDRLWELYVDEKSESLHQSNDDEPGGVVGSRQAWSEVEAPGEDPAFFSQKREDLILWNLDQTTRGDPYEAKLLNLLEDERAKPRREEMRAAPRQAAYEGVDDEEFEHPDEEDAFVESDGNKLSVFFGTKHLGDFVEESEALDAIRAEGNKHQYFPNVWYVSDHGNVSLVEDFSWDE